MNSPGQLSERDARALWHPYTQHALADPPLEIVSARGATLELSDGRRILDAISSWWACLHGHSEPSLVEALSRQAGELDHVLFAGATHEPAVRLAEDLLAVAPRGLSRVFYSDDGSTAVEVALKMAYQAWTHAGEPARTRFVTLTGAYHGDTFGAMSVSDPDPFFESYRPFLFETTRVAARAEAVAAALAELGGTAAGVLVEPLVQGAGGMLMHSVEELRGMRAACDAAGVPLLVDEVATGFGRTGALFACEKAGIEPDILCLGKGITGGILPLAATLTTEAVYEAFLHRDRTKTLFHGHTFTANPLGCAVGIASLELCRERDVPRLLDEIGLRIETRLKEARLDPTQVADLRRTGGIVALELSPPPGERAGYMAALGPRLLRGAIDLGVLLRPLGNVLYAMPPACTSPEECDRIAAAMADLSRRASVSDPSHPVGDDQPYPDSTSPPRDAEV